MGKKRKIRSVQTGSRPIGMKRSSSMKLAGFICFTLIMSAAAITPTSADPDVALDFKFLTMGTKRARVIEQLGNPTSQQHDRTIIFIAWRKLSWVAEQRRHVAWFLHDRLIRTRVCDVTDPTC